MKPPYTLVLEIANGPRERVQFKSLPGEELVVGRDKTSSCVVIDPRLSREHFLISFCGQDWRIRDLKSANGTFVNSERISSCKLNGGDLIQAGDTLFQVSFESYIHSNWNARQTIDDREH